MICSKSTFLDQQNKFKNFSNQKNFFFVNFDTLQGGSLRILNLKSVVELSQFLFFFSSPFGRLVSVICCKFTIVVSWPTFYSKSIRTKIYMQLARGSGGAAPGKFCDSKSKYIYFLTISLSQNANIQRKIGLIFPFRIPQKFPPVPWGGRVKSILLTFENSQVVELSQWSS